MLNEFIDYINRENLLRHDNWILMAVSGGLDSVVMTDLFHHAGYSFGIAHVNFALRGKESERDEQFVRNLADKYKSPSYFIRFDTKQYARKNKLSVQMAARQLRYDWFRQVVSEVGYDFIATAHHLDDQIETFLINLARGTGIAGLHGILPKHGVIIRPLLFASRSQLENYAQENNLDFVEDSSNASLKYSRNRIRHKVIPELEKINPSFRTEFARTIQNIRDAETVYRSVIDIEKKRLLIPHESGYQIPLVLLKQMKPLRTWLFELLSPFDFNVAVVNDVLNTLDDPPGKLFYSATHRVVKDRECLLIDPLPVSNAQHNLPTGCFPIFQSDLRIDFPVKLVLKVHDASGFVISSRSQTACLDLDKLKFPLSLRKWKKGDYFIPLGMSGRKKISDFFTDQKYSIPEKEKSWLLCSGPDIVWIIGHRIDDRYKITGETERVLEIDLNPSKSDVKN
ncbi:MAG: tRNA lysidine(34) synthetase TilS [Bacteroidales bacterium]|nr:tRNA lysidine(34) synthetase TilS [Bacteroidales bacterium]